MMHMVLEPWEKREPVQAKNKTYRMISISTLPPSQNLWQVSEHFSQVIKILLNFFNTNMRSQIFAKSLPMPMVQSALVRLNMLRTMPELKNKLWENATALQDGLKARGFDIGITNSCVTPVYMHGSVEEAMAMVYDMRENYLIFCSIVVYPVIPKGMILLRLIPTAVHTMEDIEETLEAFSAVSGKLKSGAYKKQEVDNLWNQ